MNGQRSAERLSEAGYQESLPLEALHLEGADRNLLPERQLDRVENAVDADEAGAGPVRLVQIHIRPAIAVNVDLLDIVIVEQQI